MCSLEWVNHKTLSHNTRVDENDDIKQDDIFMSMFDFYLQTKFTDTNSANRGGLGVRGGEGEAA